MNCARSRQNQVIYHHVDTGVGRRSTLGLDRLDGATGFAVEIFAYFLIRHTPLFQLLTNDHKKKILTVTTLHTMCPKIL